MDAETYSEFASECNQLSFPNRSLQDFHYEFLLGIGVASLQRLNGYKPLYRENRPTFAHALMSSAVPFTISCIRPLMVLPSGAISSASFTFLSLRET
jgi:hypothetical protein